MYVTPNLAQLLLQGRLEDSHRDPEQKEEEETRKGGAVAQHRSVALCWAIATGSLLFTSRHVPDADVTWQQEKTEEGRAELGQAQTTEGEREAANLNLWCSA